VLSAISLGAGRGDGERDSSLSRFEGDSEREDWTEGAMDRLLVPSGRFSVKPRVVWRRGRETRSATVEMFAKRTERGFFGFLKLEIAGVYTRLGRWLLSAGVQESELLRKEERAIYKEKERRTYR